MEAAEWSEAGRRGAKLRFLLAAGEVRLERTPDTEIADTEPASPPMKGESAATEGACIEMLSLSSMTRLGKWQRQGPGGPACPVGRPRQRGMTGPMRAPSSSETGLREIGLQETGLS